MTLKAFSACGIELEYMIVDRQSLAVLPIADRLLELAAGCQACEVGRGHFGWSNELVLHLVEIKNAQPDASLAALAAGFQSEVVAINALLADFGAMLMPTAAHPWMDPRYETRIWPHQNAAIYRSYDRIFDCRQHGWANLQSMHVNLPFAGDAEFERLHAAIRVLLPILPALAASSPLAEGVRQDYLDFRLQSYRFHPRRVPSLIGQVVPDNASSRAEYEHTVLAAMYRDIAPFDTEGVLRHEWLNTRGAIPRFDRNAIEIRVIDLQECPLADMAIAALATAVTRMLHLNRFAPLEALQAQQTGALAEILLGCIRDAECSIIADRSYLALFGYPGSCCEARELWLHLLETCAADPQLTPGYRAALELILARGPLARRILAALGERTDRAGQEAVYRELCDCLATGRMFTHEGPG